MARLLLVHHSPTDSVRRLTEAVLAGAGDGRRKRLDATRADGPAPTIERFDDGDAELLALAARIRGWIGEGIAPAEVAPFRMGFDQSFRAILTLELAKRRGP